MSLCQNDIAYDAPEWLTGEHMTGQFDIKYNSVYLMKMKTI